MKILIFFLALITAAAAQTASVSIEWDKNPEPDMKEYRATFVEFGNPMPIPIVKTVTDPLVTADLTRGKYWLVTVVAINTHLKESAPSNPFVFLADEPTNVPPPSVPGGTRIKGLSVTIEKKTDSLKIEIVEK